MATSAEAPRPGLEIAHPGEIPGGQARSDSVIGLQWRPSSETVTVCAGHSWAGVEQETWTRPGGIGLIHSVASRGAGFPSPPPSQVKSRVVV